MRIDLESLNKQTRQPLHEQLSELLRGAIRAGVYQPGERIEPERTFAKHSRLSLPTVARAIRELADEGLVVRRTGSGTFVNESPTRRMRQLRRVGVSYYDTRTPYFERLFSGIQAAAGGDGIELIPLPAGTDIEHEDHVIDLLERERVDGVIAIPFGTDLMQRALQRLILGGTTVVGVGVQLPQIQCDTLGFDSEMSGQLAGHHLLELQHRRLAMFCVEHRYPDTSTLDLIAGVRSDCLKFDAELPEASIVKVPHMFDEANDPRPRNQLRALFDKDPSRRPTALVCSTDGLARYAYEALGKAGLRVPEDVSIIGGGNLPLAAQLDPPLTTIDWPLERLGVTAIRMLHTRHDFPERRPIHRVLDTQLIARRSSSVAPQ